ncbi:hypothetical protein [Mycolicibacterium houstonense]|uniref:hypothetical protein n=1 Tax=Mycolicibacterium houstonense TaxID=146021 RepID=UPI000B09E0E1|nr:hypothetical protein [Mycolicibacterium houstonense]
MQRKLIGGMNRYRAWIDQGPECVMAAVWIFSLLAWGSIAAIVIGIADGRMWLTALGAVGALVSAYLGIAQMTQWKWDGR